MRRATVVLAVLATMAPLIHAPPARAETPTGPCTGYRWLAKDVSGPDRPIIVAERVADLIWCAVRRWPVPGGYQKALDIAYRESRLLWWAANPSRAACDDGWGSCGVYQHAARYWPGRVRHYLRPEWFPNTWPDVPWWNARANVIVAIRMAHTGGWGPWRSP